MGEDDPEFEAALAQVTNRQDEDSKNMARMEEEAEADAGRMALLREGTDNESDSGDALPPPASAEEIEEARQIVQKAEKEAAEREKMKAKAKTASKDDLQAMINARLAQKK